MNLLKNVDLKAKHFNNLQFNKRKAKRGKSAKPEKSDYSTHVQPYSNGLSRQASFKSQGSPCTPMKTSESARILSYSNSSPQNRKKKFPRLQSGLVNVASPRSSKTLHLDTIFEDENYQQDQNQHTFQKLRIEHPSIFEKKASEEYKEMEE